MRRCNSSAISAKLSIGIVSGRPKLERFNDLRELDDPRFIWSRTSSYLGHYLTRVIITGEEPENQEKVQ
ncbi:MAG: hypothetical protein ACRD22_19765 [Terriglobia bacterium]